jgi:hypothetical protein
MSGRKPYQRQTARVWERELEDSKEGLIWVMQIDYYHVKEK